MAKLRPVIKLDGIEKIFLLRDRPINYKKITNYIPPKIFCKVTALRDIYRLTAALLLGSKSKIDVVMGIYFFPHGLLAFIVGKLLGVPVIQNIIGDDFKRIFERNIFVKIISAADSIVVRGENSKKYLIKSGIDEKKIFIIPNLLNFDKFNPSDSADNQYDLIYVGYIGKIKRLDVLVRLISKLKFEHQLSDIKLAIVGDGPCKERIVKFAKQLDVSDNIHFLGYKKDIGRYLNMSKLFIMTSEYEGLPMAMIEAMACGLPCIMPDVSNINTVAIHNYNSLLYPFGDIEICGNHVVKLLKNKQLFKRLSKNALKIKTEKEFEYSMDGISNIWKDCLSIL